MEVIDIRLYSKEPHVSQILTGFCMLKSEGRVQYKIKEGNIPAGIQGAFVEAVYKGKRVIYDVSDGYQDTSAILELLKQCDFYFKRSFSQEKNEMFGKWAANKIFPLGLNYHVSCHTHPLDKPYWKERIKQLLGIECNMYSNTYFTARRFEEKPQYKEREFKVLFATRLWGEDQSLPEWLNEERRYINQMRINIIRALKEMQGVEFIGGISNNSFSRKTAPDLLMPEKMTNRKSYIKLLHTADICIGTMGLHESIGWKTGEYVAAAKAIVNEALHYQVPGEFHEGKNYLAFTNETECIEGVRRLLADPNKLYRMKLANQAYYDKYLRPDSLIENTLEIVDLSMKQIAE